MGVSPFLYTNIQHISAKSKCPPSGLEISLFLIFYTWQPLAQNSEKICAAWSHAKAQSFAKRLRSSAVSACNNFHTELKVAVRTCEGKAIHGRHRIPAERYGLTQTAQTFASKFCVFLCCVQIFSHAKAQSFAKRLRGSAQSACNIFTQESTEDTEFSADLLVSTGIFLNH